LIEISELERRVLVGDAARDGSADVLLLVTDWLPRLIEEQALVPLDDFLADRAPDGWPDAWVPSLRSLQQGPDGRTYGIAYHDGPVMLLYRRDLYEDREEQRRFEQRHGRPLHPASSWEELREQARFFTRPTDGLYGTLLAGFPDEHNNVYDFLTQLWSRGGELVLEGATSGLATPAAAEAYDYLHTLWHLDGVIDRRAASWDSVASGTHFAAGEAALMVNWCGFASLSADPSSPTHGRVGCAAVPSASPERSAAATMNAYWVLALPAGCARPRRAYELIRRLAASEMDLVTARAGGTATRRDTWSRPDVQALAPYYGVLEDAHRGARAIPRDPDWPAVAGVLNEMMRRLVEEGAGQEARLDAHEQLAGLLEMRSRSPRQATSGEAGR
ncbi:MAG TPA: extracellular solute-binding protein, partial [Acidimicrobiales bacterium]|nr:extracellular solute-binding protein [Acidimicrobiales bacterium]